MAKRKGKGQRSLERAVKGAFGTKRDRLRLVPALMGAYVNGQKTLKVAGRSDFVWVRLRGATSEVAQAFNDVVGEHWDLPITIKRDEMAHDRWRIHARDIRAYADWGGASYLPPHAESHSFGDPNQTGGIDPVWVFKRQYMPMLPRPMVSGSMGIYIEPDFYYFQGNYHWWPGSGTADLSGYLPTGAYNALFVTVYIEGDTGIPQYIVGPEFDFLVSGPWSSSTDPGTYISLPDSSQGIPIAAVRLYTGSTTLGWGDIYDLRSPQQPLGATGSYVNIYDEGIYQGAVGSIDFIGDNVEAIVSGAYAYIVHTGTAAGHETGTMVIYDEGDWLGVFEEMRFIGAGVHAYNSGSYVAVAITGTAIETPVTGSVTVYDENALLGQADGFNFVGDNVEAVMSGTTAHIMVTGTAGGGGHETGTMVIYDEGDWLGVFEEMRFIGAGVRAYNSGSYVAVAITGTAIETPVTGSVTVYDEGSLLGQADGFNFAGDNVEAVMSGSIAHIMVTGSAGGHLTGTMVIYDEGDWLGVFEEMRFIGAGVRAYNSGSYVAIAITGTAIETPVTGSVTVYDENVLLGQADGFNFVGDNVEAVMSGTIAHIMVTGTAGGGGHETGTMVIYDEGDWLGVFEEMRFIGAGVTARSSGTYVAVDIPGGGGTLANYTRSGEALPMATITGGYWQVPDGVYSTGSLAIMINGVWQIPVIDFQEQHPTSGTFVIGEQGISTGSFVAAVWGAPT